MGIEHTRKDYDTTLHYLGEGIWAGIDGETVILRTNGARILMPLDIADTLYTMLADQARAPRYENGFPS